MIDAFTQPTNKNGLRVIKTAKTIEEINNATKEACWPLIKQVVPSHQISHKLCIIQNRKTGEVKPVVDRRTMIKQIHGEDWEVVLPFFSYYPHAFPNPYAAYLIPKDIAVDEKVFVEEVIEDILNFSWQGNGIRLKSAEAIWDGKDLRIIEGQAFEEDAKVMGRRRIRGRKIIG
jgi:hypothetical protein